MNNLAAEYKRGLVVWYLGKEVQVSGSMKVFCRRNGYDVVLMTQTGTMLYHDEGITLSQRVSSVSNVAALYL